MANEISIEQDTLLQSWSRVIIKQDPAALGGGLTSVKKGAVLFLAALLTMILLVAPGQASMPNPPPVTNPTFSDDFTDPAYTAKNWNSFGPYSMSNSVLSLQADRLSGGFSGLVTKNKYHYGTLVFNLSLPTRATRALIALIGFSGPSATNGTRLVAFNFTAIFGTTQLSAVVGSVPGSYDCTGKPAYYCQQSQAFLTSDVDMSGFNIFQIQWGKSNSTGASQMTFTFNGVSAVINPNTPVTQDIDNYALYITLGLATDSDTPIILKADYVLKGDAPYPIPEFSTSLVLLVGLMSTALIGRKYSRRRRIAYEIR